MRTQIPPPPPSASKAPFILQKYFGKRCNKMHNTSKTLLVLMMLLLPLLPVVHADESTDNTLEARGISASFTNEFVELSWRNIITSDVMLLDNMHQSTYEILRHIQPITLDMVDSLQPIISNIEVCSLTDNNSICSGKNHSLTWASPEGTDGVFHYGVVTVLPDGSRTTTLTPGLSQLSSGLVELVATHWGPTNLQGSYDANSKTTTLIWDNLVGSDNNYQIWIWRHSEEATRNNWSSLNKTSSAVIFDASIDSWTGTIGGEVERDAWYSVIYDNGTYSDTRLLGGNTLATAIYEDNIAPELRSELTAIFHIDSGITQLNWDGANIENTSINIRRSSIPIDSPSSAGVAHIANLEGSTTSFEYVVPFGEFGNFWYAVTLADEIGNEIDDFLPHHPISEGVFENTIAEESLTVASNIQVEQLMSIEQTKMIEISWADSEIIANATYHIWRSSMGEILQVNGDFIHEDLEYIGNATSGTSSIILPLVEEIDRDSWYAITVEGLFGDSLTTYTHETIYSGINSMNYSIHEDTTPPPSVLDLQATVNGSDDSVELQWSSIDDVKQWQVWYSNNISLSQIPVGEISEENGWFLHEQFNSTNGQSEYESEIYYSNTSSIYSIFAVFGIDEYGNYKSNISSPEMYKVKFLDFEISNLSINVQITSLSMTISERELSSGDTIVLGAWEQGTEVGMLIYGLENLSQISISYKTECGDVSEIVTQCQWEELTPNPAIWHFSASHSLPSTDFIGSETMYILYMDHNQNQGLVGLSYTVFVSANQENEGGGNSEIDTPSTQSTTQDMTGLMVILVIVGLLAAIRIINKIEPENNLALSQTITPFPHQADGTEEE
ncbi:MAG TPA: hypothetical protein EYQ53_03360 [Candidatus Poseidoniales archaeon]|nr:hypothetical protein [Candidatus Poseidoniales archaeon]